MTTGGLSWLPHAGRPDASPGAPLSLLFLSQALESVSAGSLPPPRSLVSVVGSLKSVHRRKELHVVMIKQAPTREGTPQTLPHTQPSCPLRQVPGYSACLTSLMVCVVLTWAFLCLQLHLPLQYGRGG